MSVLDYILFGDPPVASPGSGSTTDRELGTGDAFPSFPGLVQYNGLLLNDDSKFDWFRIESFDGLDDADLRDFRANKPFDDGEDLYGTLYGGRSMVIRGEIRAYHLWKTDDMREALLAAFALRGGFGIVNPEKPLWLRRGDTSKDRLIYCKKNAKIEIPWAQPTKQMPWVPFMIPLRASDPRMLSYLVHTHTQEGEGSFSLSNAGNFPSKLLIRFYGPCTTMTLEREFEGFTQTISVGPLASDEYVEILGARVRDQDNLNAYNLLNDDSDKMTLGPAPSANNFELSGTGMTGDSAVLLTYRDSWV